MPAKRNDTLQDREEAWSRINLIWDKVFPMGSIKFLANDISPSQYKKISAYHPVGKDVMVKVANILGVPVREIDPQRRKEWTRDIDSVIQDAMETKGSGGGLMLMNSSVEVANLIFQALEMIYVKRSAIINEAIAEMVTSREEYAAMAITQLLMGNKKFFEDAEEEGDGAQELPW